MGMIEYAWRDYEWNVLGETSRISYIQLGYKILSTSTIFACFKISHFLVPHKFGFKGKGKAM